MSKKRPRQFEDEPDDVQMLGTGSYCFFHVPKDNKPKKRIVGFVRPKTKRTGAQRPRKKNGKS